MKIPHVSLQVSLSLACSALRSFLRLSLLFPWPHSFFSLPRLSQPSYREVCTWRTPHVSALWHTQNPSAEVRPMRKKRTSAPWALCLAASCPTMSMLFFERRGSVSGCEINAHFRPWPRMCARQPCLVGARWNLPRRVWHVASVRFFRTGRERFRVPCKIYTRPQVFCTSWQARRRAAPRKILAPGDCFRFPVAPPPPFPGKGEGGGGAL